MPSKQRGGNGLKAAARTGTAKLIHVHPVWYFFAKYGEILEYEEIDKPEIQIGPPESTEEIRKKTSFIKISR